MSFAGDDSGRVVIWNMAPVVKEQAEDDTNIPKLLCQLDNHLGCYFLVMITTTIFYCIHSSSLC